jgi:hypothetical protein
VTSVTGISCEPLGWLASDVKDHQADPDFYDVHGPSDRTRHDTHRKMTGSLGKQESEERSTARVIVDRARLWAIGTLSSWLSGLVLGTPPDTATHTQGATAAHRLLP